MTVLHSGTTKQYSDNWEQAFGKGKNKSSAGTKKKASAKKASPKKKASTKKASKKGPAKRKSTKR